MLLVVERIGGACPEAWLPWLAVAGLGILHGLNPANGWLFVAARATEHRDGRAGRRSLLPLASGHAVSVLLVVVVVMQGAIPDGKRFQLAGGLLLLALAAWRILRRHADHPCTASVHMRHPATGLALWSCLMGTAHGSGLMLVPALIPLCLSAGPARTITASGSLMLMLAAVILHLLAMLSTTYLIASGVCRLRTHRMTRYARHLPWLWTLLLALTGAAMIAMR